MPGVSYYQVLGVEPDAEPSAIKAAWREATDKFEPGQGSGQFRLFNEAADVLLDPRRRAAYDEELGVEAPPASVRPVSPLPVTHQVVQATPAVPRRSKRSRRSRDSKDMRRPATTTGRGVPTWVIAALGVLCAVALAIGFLLLKLDDDQSRVGDAGDSASAAAERALPVILSYDYRHLTADRDQSVRFMTPTYRREYTATFDKLINTNASGPGPAVQLKAVVKASVENVGVVSAESDRVRVIAFVNQTTTKGSGDPTLSRSRLTVAMSKSGNQWLVDNIDSY